MCFLFSQIVSVGVFFFIWSYTHSREGSAGERCPGWKSCWASCRLSPLPWGAEGRGFMRGMCTSRWESWGRGGHHRILPITAWMQTNRENSPKTLEGRGNKVTCFLLWTLPFKLSHGLIFSYVSLWLFQLTCLFAFSLLRRSFLLIPRGLKDAWVIFHIPWTFILVFCYEGPS